MVKAAPKKRKSNANVDFKHVKRRVGKKAPLSSTHLDLSFKAKTINVREQSVAADKGDDVLSGKGLTVSESLSKIRHHSGYVRQEALAGLLSIFDRHSSSPRFLSQLSAILVTAVEAIDDDEKAVRITARQLFQSLLLIRYPNHGKAGIAHENTVDKVSISSGSAPNGSAHWCSPFFRLIFLHVCASFSSLELDKRLDALAFMELLVLHFPRQICDHESELVVLYAALVSTILGKLRSRRNVNPAKSGAEPIVSVSRRSGGILANFKNSQRSAKASKRKSENSQLKNSNSNGDTETPDPEKLWLNVLQSTRSIVEHFEHFRESTLPAPTTRDGRNLHCLGKRKETVSVKVGKYGQGLSHDAFKSYLESLPVFLQLWQQSYSLYIGSINVLQASAREQIIDDHTTQWLEVSKLILMVVTNILKFGKLMSQEEAGTAIEFGNEILSSLDGMFPVKTLCRNQGHIKKVSRINMNLSLIMLSLIRESNNCRFNERSIASAAERGCKWIQGELSRDDNGNASYGQDMSEIFFIADDFLKAVSVHSTFEAAKDESGSIELENGLRASILALIDNWFKRASVSDSKSAFPTTKPLLVCVERYLHRLDDCDLETIKEHLENWTKQLPRIAWQACRENESLSLLPYVLSALKRIATETELRCPLDPNSWQQIVNSLTALMFAKTKKTQVGVFGPFVEKLPSKVKLQYLELLSILPVRELPSALLVAVIMVLDKLQCLDAPSSLISSSDDEPFSEDLHLLFSRLIQLPFVIFRRLYCGENNPFPEETPDLISFSLSVLWGKFSGLSENSIDCHNSSGSSDISIQLKASILDGSILRTTQQLCERLLSLKFELGVPVARLLYTPLLGLLDETDGVGSTENEADSVVFSSFFKQSQYATHEAEGSSNQIRFLVTQARFLRVAHLACYLHSADFDDAFPPSFLHGLTLVTGLMCMKSSLFGCVSSDDSRNDFIFKDILKGLLRICSILDLAISVKRHLKQVRYKEETAAIAIVCSFAAICRCRKSISMLGGYVDSTKLHSASEAYSFIIDSVKSLQKPDRQLRRCLEDIRLLRETFHPKTSST